MTTQAQEGTTMTAEERSRELLCGLDEIARVARPFGNARGVAFDMIERVILAAESSARQKALEEAAQLADDHDCSHEGECPKDCDVCVVAKQIARAIRGLKETT